MGWGSYTINVCGPHLHIHAVSHNNTTTQQHGVQPVDTFEHVVALLPALQRSISVLHERECDTQAIPIHEVQCVVDVSIPRGMRIEPGTTPHIRISALWAFDCVISDKSDLIVSALRRAVRIAHARMRWTLSNRPRNAAEYIESARRFRMCNPETFSLPVQSFRTRLTVTMSDPMTGETETRTDVRHEELQDVERELAHILTARVYAHDQIAELLDTLQAHKQAVSESQVSSIELVQIAPNHCLETINYDDPTI